jgi:hypothetical protein
MRSAGYLFMAIAAAIGMFAAFVLFIYTLATFDYHNNVESVILYIFLFLGLMLAAVLIMVFSLLRYIRSKAGRSNITMTKNCASCGQTMGATEFSCPKCRSLQPSYDDGRRG